MSAARSLRAALAILAALCVAASLAHSQQPATNSPREDRLPDIQPAFRIGYADSDYISGIAFSPSGEKLYVLSTPAVTNLWDALVYSWPETGAIVTFLLACPLVVWLIVRLRRHQVRGNQYCRRCNYDLSGIPSNPIGTAPDARCPECGVLLAKRRAVTGRSTLQRLRVPAVALVAVLMGYVAPWLLSAPRQGWLNEQYMFQWPWLERQIAAIRPAMLKPFYQFVSRIDQIDVKTGTVERTLGLYVRGADGGLSRSPDGGSLFLRQRGRILRVDAQSGRVLVAIETGSSLRDWRDLAIDAFHPSRPVAYFADASPQGKSRLRSWDLHTDEVKTILEETCPQHTSGATCIRTYVIVSSSPADCVLSCPGLGDESREFRLYGLDGTPVHTFNLSDEFALTALPVLSPSGRLLWPGLAPSIGVIDPLSGALHAVMPMGSGSSSRLAISKDGRFLAWPQATGNVIALFDTVAQRRRLPLAIPSGWFAPNHIVFSDNRRFVAADPFRRITPGAIRDFNDVFVYDLKPLNDRIESEPSTPPDSNP